jgi:hypothetical protein
MPYVIDGYNLLRAVQKNFDSLSHISEYEFCSFISEFIRRKKSHGYLFFDGTGPPDRSNLAGFKYLDVIFTGPDTDADTMIEELIAKNTHPKRLNIISSDRRIRTAARKRRAKSIPSLEFWELVAKKLTQKPKHPPEPPQKFHGLTESEVDAWLKIFRL